MKEFFLFSKCFCKCLFLSHMNEIISKHKLKQGLRFRRLKFRTIHSSSSTKSLFNISMSDLINIGPHQIKKEKGISNES